MEFQQIIFFGFDTSIADGITRKIQIRATRNSRDPYAGNRRGLWDSATDYALDDFVYLADGTRWFCIQANNGNTPADGSSYWTRADLWMWAYPDPTKVLILPGLTAYVIGKPNPTSAHPTRELGKLTPDTRELVLRDTFEITNAFDGTGAPVSIDFLGGSYRSLLNELFDNPDALTMWSFNQITDDTATYADYADESKFDLYWMGDSKNNSNTTPVEITLSEEDENALQIQQIHVQIEGLSLRAQSLTVRDFLDTTSDTDFTNIMRRAFFANYVVQEGSTPTKYVEGDDSGSALFMRVDGGTDYVRVDLAAISINDKLHFATYEFILSQMAKVMGCTTDPTQWSSNMQPWKDKTNQTSKVIETDRVPFYADHTWMGTTGVCLEHTFSIDPRCDWTVQQAAHSTGFSWDTPLATVLEKFATQWVCKIEFYYDQTTKTPAFVLRDLFEVAIEVADAATAPIGTGDVTISVTDAAALYAASNIIEITDGLNTEYAKATAGSGTSLTVTRPNPIAFSTGAVVNAIQTIPSALKGRGDWLHNKTVREQQVIEQGHVETKASSGGDILASPNLRGSAIEKEMPHRTKIFSWLGSKQQFHESLDTYNTDMPQDKQQSCWKSWTGGRQQRHIVADDATITLVDNTHTNYNIYTVQSNSSTFWNLRKWAYGSTPLASFWDDPSTDVMMFSNGAFGVIVQDDVPLTDGQNSVMVLVNQLQSINPPVVGGIGATATNELITVGFEPAARALSVDFSSFNLTGGLATATVTGNLTGQSMFKNTWKGMQFIFPKYGVFTLSDVGSYSGGVTSLTFDRSFPVDDSAAYARAGGVELNGDCQVGAYMYYDNSTDLRYHPFLYDGGNTHKYIDKFRPYTNIVPTDAGFYSGAYTVNRLCYGLPEFTENPAVPWPPNDNHGIESYTAAQVYAELYIGNYSQVTRYYNGVAAADGKISSVKNGMMWCEYREGELRFYQVLGRDIDEFALGRGETVLHCIEKKPLGNIHRNKVWKKGRNTTGGGGGTVGGSSGVRGGTPSGPASSGTVDLGAAVLTRPNTAQRNRVKSTVDGVSPLEIQRRFTSSTDDLLPFWDDDGTTKLLAVDYHGNLYPREGTLTLANGDNNNVDVSAYQNYHITGPTTAFAITGLAKPTLGGVDAHRFAQTFINYTSQTLTVKNNSGSSTTGNKIRVPGGSDVTVSQYESFTALYDLTAGEWVVQSFGKAPVTLTGVVKTGPTTGENIIQPITNGVPAAQFKNKSGDTGDNTRWYDSSGTLIGLVAYTGELDWRYTVNITPTSDIAALVSDKASGHTADHIQFKLNGSTVGYINYNAAFHGSQVVLSDTGTLLDLTSSASAASALSIITVANTGTGGRGQFALLANGSVTFGPLTDTQNNFTGAFALSGNLLRPSRSLNANTTLTATDTGADVDTSGGNRTITLPAHTSCKGALYIIRKAAAANTLTVAESGGGNLKAWTANGEMHIFFSYPNGWGVM